ncbi:hypothetical protein [Kitasatospora cineracea]|uniref:hypothetical protein n=1 Tax=Kitasatospora cineracea TaxID=88074 RepID=UPI0036950260
MTTQPLDTAAIQARHDAATPGTWWRDGSEIHAGEPGTPAASTWVAETVNLNLPDHGEANAEAIVAAHNAMPALLARVAELETERAQYIADPTTREEPAELGRRLTAIEQLIPAHPDDDPDAPYISPRMLRAALDGDTLRVHPHAPDEWLRCSGLHCPCAERYAKAAERGWAPVGMGQWLCPDCRTAPSAAPGAR